MDIHQGGQVVAGMEVKFTVFDENIISQSEKKLAATAVQHYLGEINSLLSPNVDGASIPAFLLAEKTVEASRSIQTLQ